MKADRLTRKTHFRRLVLPDQAASRPDLQDLSRLLTLYPLADLIVPAGRLDSDVRQSDRFSFIQARDALLWCARIVCESPTARMLFSAAARQGWAVMFSDLKNQGFCIDAAERTIILDHFALTPAALGTSSYFRHVMLTTLIRALRETWHEDRLQGADMLYAPEQLLMLKRVCAADCDTVTILCGWELRGAGFTEIWRHLLGSEEGDMAVIFTRFLERDPGALFSGAALAYAFRQWYADGGRADGADHDTLEALDRLLDDAGEKQSFGKKRLDAAGLESLSVLPDGKCYLAGLGEGILRDPFFAGLNDAINQTHLFHLMYDMDVVMVNNVPFRDARLARLIFPDGNHVLIQ